MSGIPKTFEGLQDLIVRDQFTFICNRELKLFLTRERTNFIGTEQQISGFLQRSKVCKFDL